MNVIKRLAYVPWIASSVSRLRLRRIAQHSYFVLRGRPEMVCLSLDGIEATFAARTPHELRCVESTWFSEKQMLVRALSCLQPGDVFVDVGGNLGMFAIFAAKMVGPEGRVIAFEPETVAFGRLKGNVALNELCNVTALQLALSDSCGSQTLILGEPDAVSQSAHIGDLGGNSQTIETATYDGLVARRELPVPQVVKVDVEGHELAALRGMAKSLSDPSCRALFCELHPQLWPAEATESEVDALVRSFGFDTLHIEGRSSQLHLAAMKRGSKLSHRIPSEIIGAQENKIERTCNES
ncbi:MAG TPA: FkbM family methyltransferase [Candidatus Acidoferrum sp.]|nr:FkbM family methyltransferase [Candidatus Acidoferrum sp.]